MAKKPANDDKRNRKEIDRVKKKRSRAVGWFIFWLSSIPAMFCGGCGLAMIIRNQTVQATLGMVALLGPFVGLGGVLLMLGDRSRYTRALALARQADDLDLIYIEQPKGSEHAFLNNFVLLQDPTNDYALNFMTGTYEGARVAILDYSCAWGHGKWARRIAQTVFVFQDALDGITELVMCPKGLFDKLAEGIGLGGKPIAVAAKKEFNNRYGVYSAERKAAADVFTSELVEICLEEKNLVLEVNGRSLLVYWSDTYVRPNELPDRLETAFGILRHLRGEKHAQ
jgi:hypothetical protein